MGMPMPPSSGGGGIPGPTFPPTGPEQMGAPGVGVGALGVHKGLKTKHHRAERKKLKKVRRGKRV